MARYFHLSGSIICYKLWRVLWWKLLSPLYFWSIPVQLYSTGCYIYPAGDIKGLYQWRVCSCHTCAHIYVWVFFLQPTWTVPWGFWSYRYHTCFLRCMFVNNILKHFIIIMYSWFHISTGKVRKNMSFRSWSWSTDLQLRYVTVCLGKPGDDDDNVNKTAKWSDLTDRSVRISFTEISPLDITKSNILPAECVGIFTCWIILNSWRRDFSIFGSTPVSMFTWKSKSLSDVRSDYQMFCTFNRKLSSSLNWDEKSCVNTPEFK